MTSSTPRHFSVFASPAYLPDVCGSFRLESYAPPSSARHASSLQLLNWTHWPLDCSYKSIEGTPLCYHVDPDVHNDAEPWQEIERVMFERWLALPQNCYRDGIQCEIRAAVIVMPSLIAHCAPYDGVHLDGWKPGMIEGRIDAHRRYWRALRLRDEMRSSQRSALGSKRRYRPQLLLMHYDGTFEMPFATAMLRALAEQPASFVRRVVIASIDTALQVQQFVDLFGGASPTFVSVPFTVLTEGTIDASAEMARRPISVLFTGRAHASFDDSRRRVHQQLRRLGAACRDGLDRRSSCALCTDARACERTFGSLGLQPYQDQAGFGALQVLALASRATFCLEPTSDTLVRSHFYVAVLMGCIPVIFDPTTPMPTPFRSDPAPFETAWAWRHLPGAAAALPGSAAALARSRLANYSAFARVEKVSNLLRGEREQLVEELWDLATDVARAPELRRMQAALAAAAQLMHYSAAAPAAGATWDAFAMLLLTMRALSLEAAREHGLGGQLGPSRSP